MTALEPVKARNLSILASSSMGDAGLALGTQNAPKTVTAECLCHASSFSFTQGRQIMARLTEVVALCSLSPLRV
jgi:hypothetical protein